MNSGWNPHSRGISSLKSSRADWKCVVPTLPDASTIITMSRSEGQIVLGNVTIRFATPLELQVLLGGRRTFPKFGEPGPNDGGPLANDGGSAGGRDAPNPPRPFCKIASASSALLPPLEPMSKYKLAWKGKINYEIFCTSRPAKGTAF